MFQVIFVKSDFKKGFTILIQIFLLESNCLLTGAWKKQTGAFATVSVKFQLHQTPYFRVSFFQFSLTKSQASKYPGKLWLTVAMICESSCALMTSPSRLFCINLKHKVHEKGQEKTQLFVSSHYSPDIPELDRKDNITHQTTSYFCHLEHTDTSFYNHCTI